MIYKPEQVVDLETGAIVDADVRSGDEHDTADLTEKVLEVEARLNDVMDDDKNTERVELVAADKGYFKLEEVYLLQGLVSSDAGRGWMRKRSELVERGFQHVLDSGGPRRTTLRGRDNTRKPYLIKTACANLSLLMRHLAGVGIPRQAPAGALVLVFAFFHAIRALFGPEEGRWTGFDAPACTPTLSVA